VGAVAFSVDLARHDSPLPSLREAGPPPPPTPTTRRSTGLGRHHDPAPTPRRRPRSVSPSSGPPPTAAPPPETRGLPATDAAPLEPRTSRYAIRRPLLGPLTGSAAIPPAAAPLLVDPGGGPITGGRVVPYCWRNSTQSGPMLLAGDINRTLYGGWYRGSGADSWTPLKGTHLSRRLTCRC